MTGFEGAVSGAKPFSGEAEISAKTSMLVVALCWIAIFFGRLRVRRGGCDRRTCDGADPREISGGVIEA